MNSRHSNPSSGGDNGSGPASVEAQAEPDADIGERAPRMSFFALVPRRNLVLAVALFGILVVVIVLKQRTGSIVKSLSDAFGGPGTTAAARPPGVRVRAPLPAPAPAPPEGRP
jgi:hypothetical protein